MIQLAALLLSLFASMVPLGAPAPLPATDEGAELVAEFKRFYPKAETARQRMEAVLVLKDIDSLAAAQAVLVALEDEDFSVQRAAIEVIAGYRQEATAHWLVDGVLLERKYAKKTAVRAGVTEALGSMGFPFAYDPVATQLGDKDVGLRLAAIRALGHLRNPAACASLSPLAADRDGTLALAAIEALGEIGSAEGAEGAVLVALDHEDWRVRARAIRAVVDLRLKSGVRRLIEKLDQEDGRLSGDAYTALKEMTLRDFGDTSEGWRGWWDRNEAAFQLPDLEKVRAAREKEAREGSKYTTGKKKAFLGVETTSENILFVIDVSGSMETPFGDPERLKSLGRTYSSLQRLQIVKEELIHTIEELPDTTSFNVLSFARDVKSWKKDPVRANVLNKSAATDWVSRLVPLGGSKSGFRAQMGLSTDEAEEGGTNTHLALMTALGAPPEGKGPAGFVVDAPKSPLDTIFFLTDGEPTVGTVLDMREIRQEVQRVNAYRGVVLHVIFVGEFGGQDMEKLAHENGGLFVAIGG